MQATWSPVLWVEAGLRSPAEHSERHSMPQRSRSARLTVVCDEHSGHAVRAVGAKKEHSVGECSWAMLPCRQVGDSNLPMLLRMAPVERTPPLLQALQAPCVTAWAGLNRQLGGKEAWPNSTHQHLCSLPPLWQRNFAGLAGQWRLEARPAASIACSCLH